MKHLEFAKDFLPFMSALRQCSSEQIFSPNCFLETILSSDYNYFVFSADINDCVSFIN